MQKEGGEFEGVEGSRDRAEGDGKIICIYFSSISWFNYV